jgi:hypothetical protein
MMESIDRVRLYQQFSKFNDADCFIIRYISTGSVYPSILFFVCSIQFAKIPTKHPPSGTDGTEDGLFIMLRKNLKREDC